MHEVRELARRLRRFNPGKWTEAELRRAAADQGWEWVADGDGPRLRTGHPAGDARLSPVDELLADHTTAEEYLGLHQPLERIRGGTREHVEAFSWAALNLRGALGDPDVMGAYDTRWSFYRDSPRWGAPFMRWRTSPASLELRATDTGPVLALQPGAPLENWYTHSYEHGNGTLSGFVASVPARRNRGLSLPGVHRHDDWREYARLLSRSLGTLPAELTALGVERSFGLHGMIPGTYGPWVFRLDIGETMRLGLDEGAVAEGVDLDALDLPSLGWTPATEPHHLDDDIAYHTGGTPYDEVNGVRLAMVVLETAEALRIGSPQDLFLTDRADEIGFRDGSRAEYVVHDHGLGVVGTP
ncbi:MULTISPECIES: hypothetical protein [unclassified Nocardiopsis]|uniref:hypothetical protein n=1 Tax=unclassified Nocardiopsis TaxID=2649073 RepID=UPI001916A46A|nr:MULTISPECIES: hypothetical protein [unclassified Nocardiopsis]